MKLEVMVIITLFVTIGFNMFIKDESWSAYKKQKKTLTSLELVKYYANINLSDNTKVDSIKFEKDTSGMEGEALVAILFIPTEEIDDLFIEDKREYTIYNALYAEETEDICFSYSEYSTVWKKRWKTQRSVIFKVLESEDGYTKIYFFVDKLGWYLWNTKELG